MTATVPGQALTEEVRVAAREIIARYPHPRSALLPMLHLVQSAEGYVSPEGIGLCAEELGLTKAEVGAVATFYTMYKRRPTGDYLVSVCTNTLCGMLGGDDIYATLAEHLGVGHDQTTADGSITFEHAECLAACDYAPVVTVNYEFFDNQTEDSALELVRELQSGGRPMPTRGAPLCSFKEISRQLAGFIDERPDALNAGPAGEPTLIGAKLAVERGETAPPYDAPRPSDEPAPARSEAPKAETPAEKSAVSGTAGYGGKPDEQTSSHDAPQETSASDPAAGTQPAGTGTPAEPSGATGVAKDDDSTMSSSETGSAGATPAEQKPAAPSARKSRSRRRPTGGQEG